eukprot:gnl/MRDRNA2_/MRDRNA2_24895_c0_seq2.p1 gnl/MRDRNA2_/MRDRNA2_24895_c0~~gnl/MRDRNA2_/MRDRNA2_24895_c0_seq2.p1  ORF type:complete len:146 (-),score=27.46 gnl/MRDRNA2_/MRDRNA2_24895_c0_seq2:32-469(-)
MSALAFQCGTDSHVRSWDLGEHKYGAYAAEFLQRNGKHEVVWGDSTVTLKNALPEPPCDLVLVDGGHDFNVAASDIVLFSKIASQGAVVIIDDCDPSGLGGMNMVNNAYAAAIQSGMLLPLWDGRSDRRERSRHLCAGQFSNTRA